MLELVDPAGRDLVVLETLSPPSSLGFDDGGFFGV